MLGWWTMRWKEWERMWLWPNGPRVHFPLTRKHPLHPPPQMTKFQTFFITWKHVYQLSVIPCSLNTRNILNWLWIFTIFFNQNIKCQIVDLETMNQQFYLKQWHTQEFCLGGVSTNSFEDREQGSGGGSTLVRGSGGSCNLVQEISFHILTFS